MVSFFILIWIKILRILSQIILQMYYIIHNILIMGLVEKVGIRYEPNVEKNLSI